MKDSANKYADDAMSFVRDRSDLLDRQSKALTLKVDTSIATIEEKVSKMDESDVIIIKVREEVKSEVDSNVSGMILKAKEDIKDYIDEMFTIQGAIGPKEKYKSITDFIRQTKSNVEHLTLDLESKMNEVKALIAEMKEQSDLDEERREKLSKQKLDHTVKEMTQEQHK